jgi:hypothetical protein
MNLATIRESIFVQPDFYESCHTSRTAQVSKMKYLRMKDCYSTVGHSYWSTRYFLWLPVSKSQRTCDQDRYRELRYVCCFSDVGRSDNLWTTATLRRLPAFLRGCFLRSYRHSRASEQRKAVRCYGWLREKRLPGAMGVDYRDFTSRLFFDLPTTPRSTAKVMSFNL